MIGRELLRSANERLLPGKLGFGPEWLVLGVNNFCNLRCRMCDVGTGDDQTNFGGNLTGAQTRIMPLELYRRIVHQLVTHAPTAQLGFAFTEPLAWPHMAEALDYARERGVRTSVTTNGLLLPRHADMLARSGTAGVHVSVDGPREIHDEIRRRKGSFDRAMEGIAQLTAHAGAPAVDVVATITAWNAGHLADFALDLAERHRAGARLAGLVVTHNSFITEAMATAHNARHGAVLPATASNVFDSDVGAIPLDTLAADLQRLAGLELPFPLQIQPHIVDLPGIERYYREHGAFVGKRCRDAFRILMIDADGEVIPTHGRCFRVPVGNIRDAELSDLWRAPALTALRRELSQAGGLLPACSRCCSAFS